MLVGTRLADVQNGRRLRVVVDAHINWVVEFGRRDKTVDPPCATAATDRCCFLVAQIQSPDSARSLLDDVQDTVVSNALHIEGRGRTKFGDGRVPVTPAVARSADRCDRATSNLSNTVTRSISDPEVCIAARGTIVHHVAWSSKTGCVAFVPVDATGVISSPACICLGPRVVGLARRSDPPNRVIAVVGDVNVRRLGRVAIVAAPLVNGDALRTLEARVCSSRVGVPIVPARDFDRRPANEVAPVHADAVGVVKVAVEALPERPARRGGERPWVACHVPQTTLNRWRDVFVHLYLAQRQVTTRIVHPHVATRGAQTGHVDDLPRRGRPHEAVAAVCCLVGWRCVACILIADADGEPRERTATTVSAVENADGANVVQPSKVYAPPGGPLTRISASAAPVCKSLVGVPVDGELGRPASSEILTRLDRRAAQCDIWTLEARRSLHGN